MWKVVEETLPEATRPEDPLKAPEYPMIVAAESYYESDVKWAEEFECEPQDAGQEAVVKEDDDRLSPEDPRRTDDPSKCERVLVGLAQLVQCDRQANERESP